MHKSVAFCFLATMDIVIILQVWEDLDSSSDEDEEEDGAAGGDTDSGMLLCEIVLLAYTSHSKGEL